VTKSSHLYQVPGKSSHFWKYYQKLVRNLAASHQTWNVKFCDENVTSHLFVTVPHPNPGPVSGKISSWNDPSWKNLRAGGSWSEQWTKVPAKRCQSGKSWNSCGAVSSGIAVIMASRREFLRLPHREIHTIAQILNDLSLSIRLGWGTLGHKCRRLSHTREYGSWLKAALLDSFISVNIHTNEYFKNHPSWQIDTVGPLDTTRPSCLRHQGRYWSVV